MMNNPLIRRLGATAVAILLLIYVGYQAYLSQYSGLRTEPAIYSTLSDSISTTGFIVRNEQVIESRYNGVLNYIIDDGERVANGGTIAEIYPNESGAAAKNRISHITDELSQLALLNSAGDFSAANPQMLGSQISDGIMSILGDLRAGSFTAFTEKKGEIQVLLSQKQIIIGAESGGDYQAYIDSLVNERTALENSSSNRIGTIKSPKMGYFIHSVDGYENVVDFDSVKNITVDGVEWLMDQEPGATSSYAIGKISRSFSWYIVCVLTENDLVRLDKTVNVTVEMPFASSELVPATVVQINRDEETGSAAVILECSYMNGDLAAARKEPLQINISSHSGVLVNESAIHFNDITTYETDENGNQVEVVHKNVRGVYVKGGSRVRFVQVFTDATVNGYAVCKTSLTNGERELLVTDRTIQIYDEVIVEGTNLYDGKML